MSSFFGKLRGNTGATSPNVGSSPSKKDTSTTPATPLEKRLGVAGPLREDGADKVFGMENFGNTCYCNSILQCLYHSKPFRDQVIQYPTRNSARPPQSLSNGQPRLRLRTPTFPNGAPSSLLSQPKTYPYGTSTLNSPARKPLHGPTNPGPGMTRPEDRPDSPEYKKKQAMIAGPILTLDDDDAETYDRSQSLFTSLKGIFEAIVAHPSRVGVVSPQQFLETLKRENEMFRTPMHQDAHEFLNLLLNEVMAGLEANAKEDASHSLASTPTLSIPAGPELSVRPLITTGTEAMAKPISGVRWVHELFEGTLTSETKCLTCEQTSSRDEPFLDLSVDLEQHSSVTSCLRKFSEEEMLCERNKFHCDNCGGLQEAEKRMKIKRLPRILALHLKRFKYTEDLQRLQKLFYRVVYPYHLRLFNTTDDAEDPDRLYELYAVVVHIGGGPYHGHYVSVIKTADRGWLLFDDELVEPVDKSYVRNFFGDRPGLACAYVLFYQETTDEAVRREQEEEANEAMATASSAHAPRLKASMSATSPGGGMPLPLVVPPPPTLVPSSHHLSPVLASPALPTPHAIPSPSKTSGPVSPEANAALNGSPLHPVVSKSGRSATSFTPSSLSSSSSTVVDGNSGITSGASSSSVHARASHGYHSIRKKMLSSFSSSHKDGSS